jgi:hypothetical protein
MGRIFLLSPANCGGRRASQVVSDRAEFPLARRLRSIEGAPLGDIFAFMSGLYFRGKLAYASAFGRALVITPTRGLLSPDVPVTSTLLLEFASVDVDADDHRYRRPMDRSVRRLRRDLTPETRVVLLGSIATGKYVDVLRTTLGERLHFPPSFVGRGDMSRGGLMLRAVADRQELDYRPLNANAPRHGARPPKLPPLTDPQRTQNIQKTRD